MKKAKVKLVFDVKKYYKFNDNIKINLTFIVFLIFKVAPKICIFLVAYSFRMQILQTFFQNWKDTVIFYHT